jgi:hypothetical protein
MTNNGDNVEPLIQFEDGRLTLSFGLYNESWREAICCECGQPIKWVLDMFSFKHNDRGGFDLGHAWCLWTPEGFDRAKAKASQNGRRPNDG